MTDTAVHHKIDRLTQAIIDLAKSIGTRLTRTQMMERLGGSDNTLRKLEPKPGSPRRDATGKFLLSDVLRWEESPYPTKEGCAS